MDNEIYLKLDPNSSRVLLVHYDPFSTTSGLMNAGETVEQARVRLSRSGVFVTELPTPEYDSSQYRAVLNYANGNAYYTYVNIPSGDAILLNTLENAIASIKTVLPMTKLLTVTSDTVDKTTFDISDIFTANINYGVAVCKNGVYLKNNIDFSVNKVGAAVTLTIFSGLTETDYAIAVAIDNLSEHTHPISNIINLQSELNGKAPLVHTHTISQITGLSGTLEGFSLIGHHHTLNDLDDAAATSTRMGLVKISDSYTSSATDTAASLLALSNGLATKSDGSHTHNYLPLTGGTLTGDLYFRNPSEVGDDSTGGKFYTGTEVPTAKNQLTWDGYLSATKIYNAAYNDVAECFFPSDGVTYTNVKNRILELDNHGKVRLASAKSNKIIGIASDNYAYLLGGMQYDIDNEVKIPVGLTGTLWVDADEEVSYNNIAKFVYSSDNGKAKTYTPGEASMKKNEGTIVGKVVDCDIIEKRYKVLISLR